MSFPNDLEPPLRSELAPVRTESPRQRPRGIRWLTWLLLLAVIGPCAIAQAPLEIGRWRLAAAVQLRSKGDKAAAYEELEKAIGWFPKNPDLIFHRARWKLDDGRKDDALADGQWAVELSPENAGVLMIRSDLLWKAGEFAQAVDDWKKVERISHLSGNPERHEALNGLAYAQALGNIEVEDALKNVDQAIELQPNSQRQILFWRFDDRADWFRTRAQFLDTRGFILHRLGRNELALADMDKAIDDLEQYRLELDKQRGRPADPKHSDDSDKTSPPLPSETRNTAVIHYHRSLVLSALDRKEEAEKDLAIARKLIGREPDETLF